MATMGKWRDKTFEVSTNKVNPFDGFSTSAEIKGKDSKSKKKKTELEEVSFSVNCHSAAGVDPENEYYSWRSRIGKTGPLYVHGRIWKSNPLKLTKVSLGGVIQDDFGRFRYTEISLTFEEVNQKETNWSKGAKAAASAAQKAARKKAKNKNKKATIKVGSKVRLTGTYWADGQKIANSMKNWTVTVGRISGSKAYISQASAWVYTSTLSLVK